MLNSEFDPLKKHGNAKFNQIFIIIYEMKILAP